MTNEKQEQGDQAIKAAPERQAIQAPDAQGARNAAASEVKSAQSLNRNAHSGSAGGDQLESIQIVALDEGGRQKVVAERPKEVRPQPEITPEFLRERAKQPDIWAQKFVADIDKAEKLPAPYRDGQITQVLKNAEAVYIPKGAADKAQLAFDQMDTGAMLAQEVKRNPAAEPVQNLHTWIKQLPEGPDKDRYSQLVREQAAELSPEAKARAESLAQTNERIRAAGLDEGGTHDVIRPEQLVLQGHVEEPENPENPWQAFKNLTPEQRAAVIRILNNASQGTIDSLNQQGSDVLQGKPVVNFVLSIDRAVRALGTGTWKDNISQWCKNLQKIAHGEPVGQQDPIEKTTTLGAGVLVKGIQGVDQVGQHAHPRAFVHDTHATAEAMRQGIGTAGQYFGEKIKNNDLGSIPGETADAANYAKEQTTKAINEFGDKDVTQQSNVLGAATTIVFLVAATQELVTPEKARKMVLLNLTDEELEAQGIKKKHIKDIPEQDIVNPIDRAASTEVKIAQLQALSQENEPLVRAFMKQLDERFGSASEVSHKTSEEIIKKPIRPKIKEIKPWFQIEHVRDSLRFRTSMENLNDLPEITKMLKNSQFEVINPDIDKLIKPKNGWRMAAFDLRAPNGQIFEFQVVPKEMDAASKLTHAFYKGNREISIREMSKQQAREILRADQEAAKIHNKAWKAYLTRTGQTKQGIEKTVNTTRKVLE